MKKYIYSLLLLLFTNNISYCQYEIKQFDGVYKLTIDFADPNYETSSNNCIIDIIDNKGSVLFDLIISNPKDAGEYSVLSGAGKAFVNQGGLAFASEGFGTITHFKDGAKDNTWEQTFTMQGGLIMKDYDRSISGRITFKGGATNTDLTKEFTAHSDIKAEKLEDKITGGFSAISGQVEFCYPGDTEWQDAKMDTELRPGMRIKTSMESTCILYLHDYTTCSLGPEGQVWINSMIEDNSKIKLVLGKLWANIKKMTKDGKMEISTTQAVAGIKGTTLVLTDDGQHSTLKVIEGTVEFTSLTNGKKIEVNTGEMVTGTETGLDTKETFDAVAESAEWDELKANSVPAKEENKPTATDNKST
ncbi:MAG: FecR domain-containing protein, partial [Chitinophagaceae bacterium]